MFYGYHSTINASIDYVWCAITVRMAYVSTEAYHEHSIHQARADEEKN